MEQIEIFNINDEYVIIKTFIRNTLLFRQMVSLFKANGGKFIDKKWKFSKNGIERLFLKLYEKFRMDYRYELIIKKLDVNLKVVKPYKEYVKELLTANKLTMMDFVSMENTTGKEIPIIDAHPLSVSIYIRAYGFYNMSSENKPEEDVPMYTDDYHLFGFLMYGLKQKPLHHKKDNVLYLKYQVPNDYIVSDYMYKQSGKFRCDLSKFNKSDYPTVCYLEEKLYSHQKEGITFLYNRKTALLADDMGLGKTLQSLMAAEQVLADQEVEKLLIICPPSLIGNWREEIRKWKISYKKIEIIPYSLIHKHEKRKLAYNTCLILDEAHYLKNPTSRRSQSCFLFVESNQDKIKRLWMLTGTPVTKNNGDLWMIAKLLGNDLASQFSFMRLGGFTGHKNDMLSGAMSSHMLMRKKEDCLDLPDRIYSVHKVKTNIPVDYEVLKYGSAALIMEHMMRIKRMAAEAKVDSTIEFLKELPKNEKVVVFSSHTKVLEKLHVTFPNSVVLNGSTKVDDRQNVVNRFQNDDKTRFFFGNIQSSGVGINLTKSSICVFNDLDWLPANIKQATDRCHRIGQDKKVLIYYILDMDLVTDYIMATKIQKRDEEISLFEQSNKSIMMILKEFLDKREK